LFNGLHLQHLAVQGQIRHELLQPAVLVFELLQPLHFGRQQPGILFFQLT
jgi:hypothetical protein